MWGRAGPRGVVWGEAGAGEEARGRKRKKKEGRGAISRRKGNGIVGGRGREERGGECSRAGQRWRRTRERKTRFRQRSFVHTRPSGRERQSDREGELAQDEAVSAETQDYTRPARPRTEHTPQRRTPRAKWRREEQREGEGREGAGTRSPRGARWEPSRAANVDRCAVTCYAAARARTTRAAAAERGRGPTVRRPAPPVPSRPVGKMGRGKSGKVQGAGWA